jgi:MFS family permease
MAVWMVPPALLTERLPSGFRGRVAGFYRLVIDVGIIVGPALIGLAIERWGFQMAAGAVAAVLVTSICLSGTLIRGVVGQGDRIR